MQSGDIITCRVVGEDNLYWFLEPTSNRKLDVILAKTRKTNRLKIGQTIDVSVKWMKSKNLTIPFVCAEFIRVKKSKIRAIMMMFLAFLIYLLLKKLIVNVIL